MRHELFSITKLLPLINILKFSILVMDCKLLVASRVTDRFVKNKQTDHLRLISFVEGGSVFPGWFFSVLSVIGIYKPVHDFKYLLFGVLVVFLHILQSDSVHHSSSV